MCIIWEWELVHYGTWEIVLSKGSVNLHFPFYSVIQFFFFSLSLSPSKDWDPNNPQFQYLYCEEHMILVRSFDIGYCSLLQTCLYSFSWQN